MRRQRLTTFLEMAIAVIAAIILGALTILMFCERNTMDFVEYREVFTPIRRSLPRSLFLSLCFLLLLAMLCYGLGRLPRGRMSWKAVAIGAAILTAVECLAWNAVYPYGPISDQGRTWKVALQLAEAGGMPVNLENPTYFAAYPQQKCMAVVMTPIARIVGGLFDNERGYSYRLVNSVAVAIIVAELCILCYQIYGSGRAVAITAMLSVVFAPNILYSAYVYGTQVALLCSLAGFICCLQYCHTNRLRWLLPAMVVMPIGVLFYISSLIAMIAMVILVLLHAMRQNRGGRQLLAVTVVAIAMVLITMGMRWSAIRHFDRMTDVPEAQGISAFSYLAMGISSEPQIGPGGYDRSGMTNYETLGPEAERAIGRENLKTYVTQYLHGERSLSFFVRKTVCQWCDPWFDSGVMTILLSNSDYVVSEKFRNAVQGVWMQRLEQLLTLYVSTCYLAAFAAVIRLFRKSADCGALVLVLYFIGGFVFQLAWETKSRYCYPYFVVLLPLFAYEVSVLGDRVAGQVRAFVQSRRGTVG